MPNKWEVRDWFVALQVNLVGLCGTVFLFLHPDPINFATWAGLCITLFSAYHWLLLRDQKIPDAV